MAEPKSTAIEIIVGEKTKKNLARLRTDLKELNGLADSLITKLSKLKINLPAKALRRGRNAGQFLFNIREVNLHAAVRTLLGRAGALGFNNGINGLVAPAALKGMFDFHFPCLLCFSFVLAGKL